MINIVRHNMLHNIQSNRSAVLHRLRFLPPIRLSSSTRFKFIPFVSSPLECLQVHFYQQLLPSESLIHPTGPERLLRLPPSLQ